MPIAEDWSSAQHPQTGRGRGGVAVAGTVGTHPEGSLAGRSVEVDQLRSAVRQVADGTGGTLVVLGEAGIGKTSVVVAGLADADELGVWVFEGAADELEQRRPFGVIADCLATGRSATERGRAAVAELLEEDSGAGVGGAWSADAPRSEFRIVEGFVALVEALSVQNPVVLVVEDLQWADPSALLVLHRLGRMVRQLPLLLVCTARPVPRSAELEGCLRGLRTAGATELVLGPLDAVAVAQVVEQLVGGPPGSSLLRQVAGTGGNPLFVTELVAALQRDGSTQFGPDGATELTRVGIPASLPLLILHRLSFLAPATLELLRIASILGSSFAVTDLSLVLGRPTVGLLSALKEALAAGILEQRGELGGLRPPGPAPGRHQ
jgi:predicted ATPase